MITSVRFPKTIAEAKKADTSKQPTMKLEEQLIMDSQARRYFEHILKAYTGIVSNETFWCGHSCIEATNKILAGRNVPDNIVKLTLYTFYLCEESFSPDITAYANFCAKLDSLTAQLIHLSTHLTYITCPATLTEYNIMLKFIKGLQSVDHNIMLKTMFQIKSMLTPVEMKGISSEPETSTYNFILGLGRRVSYYDKITKTTIDTASLLKDFDLNSHALAEKEEETADTVDNNSTNTADAEAVHSDYSGLGIHEKTLHTEINIKSVCNIIMTTYNGSNTHVTQENVVESMNDLIEVFTANADNLTKLNPEIFSYCTQSAILSMKTIITTMAKLGITLLPKDIEKFNNFQQAISHLNATELSNYLKTLS